MEQTTELENKPKSLFNKIFITNLLLIITALVIVFVGFPFLMKKLSAPVTTPLPFLGECKIDTIRNKSNFVIETKHHTVKNFSFINQNGKIVTEKDYNGKIYVANFFFTTCRSICPIMNNQLKRVVDEFNNNHNVLFLSHTVYPERDSVNVLAAYSQEMNADTSRWQFVTGNKKDLYDMARKGYLLSAGTGDGGKDDFVHTQMLVLVDNNKHLRGFYDGLDSASVNKLISDIKKLLKYNETISR